MKRIKFLTIFVILGWLSACGNRPVLPPQAEITDPQSTTTTVTIQVGATYWPTQGWRVSTPQEQGMDTARLDALLEKIKQEKIRLHSLLVIRNGYIVSEEYFSGFRQDGKHVLYSCTKSFVSTLVGIAIDQGLIESVDQPILGLLGERDIPNLTPDKERMTLEHVLTMTAGLGWVEADATFQRLYMSPNWVKTILDLPMISTPGSQFLYCSGCSHLLSAVVQRALKKEELAEYAQRVLFTPLGITDLTWETDAQGIPIGGWGLYLTPRDMAKLGYLFLHQGTWDKQVIVSSQWVERATSPLVATDGNFKYGYQWWVIPEQGAFAALGRGGQTIYVKPEANLIVVMTAELENHDEIFKLINEYILPAM